MKNVVIALAVLLVCCGAANSLAQNAGERFTTGSASVHVSESVARAFVVKEVQPVYPAEALRKRITGQVKMTVEITEAGDVVDVVANSGNLLLVPAAVDAMKQWKFKPYLLNGQAVKVEAHITMSFPAGTR